MKMDLEEMQQNNMISNLPLLFANGYPTSLDKISEPQLENFIPFMVQCSLGHINLQGQIDYSEPEWWPEDLPFTVPFSRPKRFVGDWMKKMKEIVMICYQFHQSPFILKFCNNLASYEHATLRFINNYNSTTSLFDRRSNKLLVTFRNENMSYDQPQRMRKCLLQQKAKNGCQMGQNIQQMMVEPAPFDIYLCDNCDAELYSKEAFLEHEKTCSVDEDDVILCDTPEPEDHKQLTALQSDDVENNELRIGFMSNFNLQYRGVGTKAKHTEANEGGASAKEEFMILDRNKRMPRRNRAVHSLTRCPTIPLSSPAGQLLLRSTKTTISPEYLAERLERVERFCHVPLLSKLSAKPKYLERRHMTSNPHCTFKKPHEYSSHVYVFPQRQFSQRRPIEDFFFLLNSSLIRRCRPISVRLKKIIERKVKNKRLQSSSKLNIKLTRDTKRSSNWKISSPATEIIVDTIDLCSSDDDDGADVSVQSTLLHHTHIKPNDSFLTKCVSSMPDRQLTAARTCLKKLSNRLNSSEVSLIPIRKTFSHGTKLHEKTSMSSSLIKTVSSSTDNTMNDSSNSANAGPLLEGNVVLSPSIGKPESEIALPKPLRPSVYIFSNYTTNPLAAIVTSSSELMGDSDTATFDVSNSNQENHLQAVGSSIATKRTTNSSSTAATDWFPDSHALSSTGNESSSQNHSLEHECSAKNLLPLMKSFGSPNVISIDLTS